MDLLGVGGMGEVYRARDRKLGREVALKVLLEEFSTDEDRLRRFEREARILASLEHSNIATLYDYLESDGVRYLVMQLVEGKTLSEKLIEDAFDVKETLTLFLQIAEALEAAHHGGIIHRDLKPANIKITEAGKAIVLDFGLSKAVRPDSNAPTVILEASASADLGHSGGEPRPQLIGTPSYMSPEQVRGAPIDQRTDIWAFGCCLFEALTRKRTFATGSSPDTLNNILYEDPDWNSLPSGIPRRLKDLVRRCLEKDPKRRLRDIGDAVIEIRELIPQIRSGLKTGPRSRGLGLSERQWNFVMAAALLLVIFIPVLFSFTRIQTRPGETIARALGVTRTMIHLPPSEAISRGAFNVGLLAISPDGESVIYPGDVDGEVYLFRRRLSELEASPIPGTRNGVAPFFSPDGNWLGFTNMTMGLAMIKRVPLAGGLPQDVIRPRGGPVRLGQTWSSDGTIIYNPTVTSALSSVPVEGGDPKPYTQLDPDKQDLIHAWPQALPEGRGVIYSAGYGQEAADVRIRIEVFVPETGKTKVLLENCSFARYANSGHLLYLQNDDDRTLMAAPFDLERLELTRAGIPVVRDLLVEPTTKKPHFAVSDNGILVYVQARNPLRNLVWVDREGKAQRLDVPAKPYGYPRVSPDGKKIAVTVDDQVDGEFWMHDVTQGTLIHHVMPGESYAPEWQSDSQGMVLSLGVAGSLDLHTWNESGNKSVRRLTTKADHQRLSSLSSDSNLAAWVELDRDTGYDVWIGPLGDESQAERICDFEAIESQPALSPDGKWLAYVSNKTREYEVYVANLDEPDRRYRVSQNGGRSPRWSGDGRELFYRTGLSMMAASFDPEADSPVEPANELFQGDYRLTALTDSVHYDVSADGQRFLMLERARGQGLNSAAGHQIIVVQNWFEELNRLSPSARSN